MRVLYRISDNSYTKPKLPNATKQRCLLNFLQHWPVSEVTVYMDRCVPETEEFLRRLTEERGLAVVPIDGGSSAGSWRIIRDEALKLPDQEFVYLVEDDYLHLDGSRAALLEGLMRADYVTLYDHPATYIPASMGGNPFVQDFGGEHTVLITTSSRHWKVTISTTMTFACRVRTLREDDVIWRRHTSGTHPMDYQAFVELREKGRLLLNPIPALSTHCEPAWLAPLIDWAAV